MSSVELESLRLIPKTIEIVSGFPETPVTWQSPVGSLRQQIVARQLVLSEVEVDGEKVMQLRKTLKRSQTKLALEIGVNRFKLLKLEAKPSWRFLPKETAETLAATLGTDIEELILPPVGDVIRQWRIARGLSMAGLAHKLEQTNKPLHKHYISAVERRVYRNLRIKSLKTFATGLDIPDEYLIKRVLPDEVETTSPILNITVKTD